MGSLVERVLNLGVEDGLDPKTAKSYRSINFLAVFFFAIALITGVVTYFTSSRAVGVLEYVVCGFYLVALPFSVGHRLGIAKNLLICVFELHMFVLAFMITVKGASGELIDVSGVLFPIIPLLALLLEVNVVAHFAVAGARCAIHLAMLTAYPGWVGRISLTASMNAIYPIAFSCPVIITGMVSLVISRETLRLEEKQAALIASLEATKAELERSLSNVKQLTGLLPICASCKKIRNDDGYWQQVESYLSQHTEVEFSHSICPPCVRKLYPELAAEVLEDD